MKTFLLTLLLALLSTFLYFSLSMRMTRQAEARDRTAALENREGAKKELEDTVTLFNKIYEDFYATNGNPAMIDVLPASKMVKHRIFKDIGYLRDRSLYCVHDLAAFRVVSVKPDRDDGGDVAEVVTEEAWSYRYVNLAGGQTGSPLRGIRLSFRYDCRRTPEGWIIEGWDPVFPEVSTGGDS
ncbi:MAG TPA: hypothetical protein PK014_03710 [Thermoanaerobaculia bacterium]|nr:hypothetical protein [Thermoanaerobaculia bacterium]HUM29118.1 hypothetical protein [Thermoanaerobaculia bacterium]HXK67495.1 hypothetical protein [Thermoanaerobaculia bacterium]